MPAAARTRAIPASVLSRKVENRRLATDLGDQLLSRADVVDGQVFVQRQHLRRTSGTMDNGLEAVRTASVIEEAPCWR